MLDNMYVRAYNVDMIKLKNENKKTEGGKMNEHSEVIRYKRLAAKYPTKINEFIGNARAALCSIALGRDFGESMENYLERNPETKRRHEAWQQVIGLLEKV